MKNILTIAAVAFTLFVNAQSTEKREIGSFNSIDASGATGITYKTGEAVSLSVEADPAEIKNVETYVKNNVLYIKTKGDFKHPVKINLSGNALKELHLSGASSFVASNEMKTDSIVIETSGASNIEMNLSSKATNTKIGGASNVHLSGNTQRLYAHIAGASTIKAFDFKSAVATVDASGASTAKIFASQKLSGNCTGASSIKFKGDPKDIYKRNTQASSIESVN